MSSSRSSCDAGILNAWRGQLGATGARRGLRTQLLQHRQELLPRFAAVYRHLRILPRRLRKTLQRRWRLSLAGVALTLTLQPLSIEAANFTAGTAAELVTAINTANSTAEADTITLTNDITLDTVDNTTYGPTGLPVVSSAITIVGNRHAIRREVSDPDLFFRLLAISETGALTVQDTTLSGGYAVGVGAPGTQGGGIYNRGQLRLAECTVSGNTASGGGGGVANSGSSNLTSSTISGNRASNHGGGVANFGSSNLTSSTISGNTTRGDGGGVLLSAYATTLQLTNSTVSGNTGVRGGGVFSRASPRHGRVDCSWVIGPDGPERQCTYTIVPAGRIALSRNLLSGNLASTGAEAFHEDYGGVFTVTSNLFGHDGITTAQALSGVTAADGNIVATSDGTTPTALADILDTTLRNNGGPTLTHNLVPTSPAIDAAGATCGLTEDQRGAPRPVDGNGDGVAACDIGAVEFGSFPSSLDCSTATASVNFPRLGNRHRYPVTISGITAPLGDTVSLTVNSIFQDEPVTNPTGKTCPDGVGIGTAVAKVRNERLLAGDGRVYHIGFTATYTAGESCTGEVTVCVPVKEGEECGDQGALFDSTVCPE